MKIEGTITGISYEPKSTERIPQSDFADFDINAATGATAVADGDFRMAVSKWVSPKRTRSYPYERVYNTLRSSCKITVIPIVKDEGLAGDRDFLQWDTVSLMSLLDVFVIVAYYVEADRKGAKITAQRFDNEYVKNKIREIKTYHSSALHWNLKEMRECLPVVAERAKSSYATIARATGVEMHRMDGIDNFIAKIGRDLHEFMASLRGKTERAQAREIATLQPKERLDSASKARITITNYLGGKYYFTCDEAEISGGKVRLIECKHSCKGLLPSKGDIRDGLLKMMLYSALQDVCADGEAMQSEAVLSLTSDRIVGRLSSEDSAADISDFCNRNSLSTAWRSVVMNLVAEAKSNNFTLLIHRPECCR